MSVFIGGDWHAGEREMHKLTRVPEGENPTIHGLYGGAAQMLLTAPLLAIGTLDDQGRPWTTLLGGGKGFAQPLGGPMIGVRADVDTMYDPVVEILVPKEKRGEDVVGYDGQGQVMAGLAIDLNARRRVKLAGRLVAAALTSYDTGESEEARGIGELQMGVKIEQSMPNCPKYLNKKVIMPASSRPRLVSEGKQLPMEALKLLNKADTIFISTTDAGRDMDTNIRGGPAGFVRVMSNRMEGAEIVYPEYSGNRLYQTLGNLRVTPLAGIVVPDFETGDVLFATGTVEILFGKDAAAILPHANLAVKLKVTSARFVKEGLTFRGVSTGDGMSPYNPAPWLLTSEGALASRLERTGEENTAKLLRKEDITPTISRYTFGIANAVVYKPGQWVALDFRQELDMGYSHMRNDDPQSLNDDFIRTFTVSSSPLPSDGGGEEKAPQDQFEITVRLHGPVTGLLKSYRSRVGLEVPLKGFGGDFIITTPGESLVPFIAGGVGITPLLGQLNCLNQSKMRLYWIIQHTDVDYVLEIFVKYPELARHARVFLTGTSSAGKEKMDKIWEFGAEVEMRRPGREDFAGAEAGEKIEQWYICAGDPLRGKLLEWLEGRTVVFESFNY